ncbi:MAG: GTPase domain-containing protein, partial [Gammaproteobacteria bacterium]
MGLLLRGYQNAADHDAQGARAQRLAELRLADTALRDLQEPVRWAARPLQVVVMGPTQVGKSTVVNLLLGQSMAAVSPLAGFTVHPHGFAAGVGQAEPTWLEPFFAGWSRCPEQDRSRERLDCYGFTVVAGDAAIGQPAVIWDTPDFDSLKAHSYQRGVLETAALADVLVLVVSKEKYADLSVWNSLQLLQPLQRPLVVCLNKITEDARTPIQQALRQRLDETAGRETPVEVVTLPHDPAIAALTGAARAAAVAQLHEAVVRALAGVD